MKFLRFSDIAERQRHAEHDAVVHALGAYTAAVELDYLLGDGETEAGTAGAALPRGVQAVELLKEPVELREKSARLVELNAELDMENNAEPQEAEKPSVLAKLKEPIPLYEPKQHQAKEACR